MGIFASPYRSIKLLSRAQAAVLALLRGDRLVTTRVPLDPLSRRAFPRLARNCVDSGLVFAEAGSSIASEDECLILAALAWTQKRRIGLKIDAGLVRALRVCTESQAMSGKSLPLTRPMRELLEARDWVDRAEPLARQPTPRSPVTKPRSESLRARAMAYAAGRPVISTAEFGRIGITRQYLSVICADGQLERIAYGRYRLPGGKREAGHR